MIKPNELDLRLPMEVANAVLTTTTKVWEILKTSYEGDAEKVKQLVTDCPELVYAQYNYTPPIHFAVREGHTRLVEYLLDHGAHAPDYRTYPFQETLQTIAGDRGFFEIETLLITYASDPAKHTHNGENGNIVYDRTPVQQEFEDAVYKKNIKRVAQILEEHPEFAKDETYFWSEGILLFAAKENNHEMIDLLIHYGAKVPEVLKWAQFYYFERLDSATYMMEKGMSANTKSWHHVTLLHDMAQKGFLEKAELLIKHGADINPIDEEYKSTPLGLAVRWGHIEMTKYLLNQGADTNKSGALWSTPLSWAKKKGFEELEEILIKAGAT